MQLHRVLAAERSAVVAQPGEDHRPVRPEVAEADVLAVGVVEHEVGQRVGPGGRTGVLAAGAGSQGHGGKGSQCAWPTSPLRTVTHDCQVMRRMTTVMPRPMSGSAIGNPIATTIALAITARLT